MIIRVSKNRYVTTQGVKTLKPITEEWSTFIQDFKNPTLDLLSFNAYSSYLAEYYTLEEKETLTDSEKKRRKEIKGFIDGLKFHGGYYFGGAFEGGKRGNKILSKSLITLDVDDIDENTNFLDLVINNSYLDQYEYIIHSTAKHLPPNHKRYRLIIPLEAEITEDIALKYECISRHIASKIMDISKFDNTAFVDNHLMLYPVIAQNTPQGYYFCYHNNTNNFLNPQEILKEYDYQDRYTFVGVDRPSVPKQPPTPQKLYSSSDSLISSYEKETIKTYLPYELQEQGINCPNDMNSHNKKFGCPCGSSDANNFGRGYVCNCFSSSHDSRLGKQGNGVYTYDIFDLYAYNNGLDTSRDFIKIAFELSRKYNVTLEKAEEIERFLNPISAKEDFKDIIVDDDVAHQGEPTPIPEITFENIDSPEVLDYIYTLKSKSDILNYIHTIEEKAKEYKKFTKISQLLKTYKSEALKQLKEKEMQNKLVSAPKWLYLDDRNQIRINEPLFCKIKEKELQCKTINGNIRTIDGKQLDDMELLSKIQAEFGGNILNNIAKRSKQLLEALKNATFSKLPPYDNRIHLANGTYNVASRNFEKEKYWCINRLNVAYNPNAKKPTKWISFLNDLLEADDIITLQEYLGYCLIQSTALQVMLFLIGSGGEGKSVIGKVLNALMGDDNVYIDKIHELQKNRFKLINLENKLLFIDDDLQTNALNDTGIIKTLITGGKSSLEPKGKPSYNAELYARGLCFGNIPLTALYDHSDGFYRRQIIIKTKTKQTNRITNFFLDKDIINTELEGVLLWCLDGLHRLIDHNFNIFISQASINTLEETKKNAFNFILFLEDTEEVEFNMSCEESATDIYANYCRWCCANGLDELKRRSIIDWLHTHEKEYNVKYSEHCHEYQSNRRVRGFKGLRLKKHYTYSTL